MKNQTPSHEPLSLIGWSGGGGGWNQHPRVDHRGKYPSEVSSLCGEWCCLVAGHARPGKHWAADPHLLARLRQNAGSKVNRSKGRRGSLSRSLILHETWECPFFVPAQNHISVKSWALRSIPMPNTCQSKVCLDQNWLNSTKPTSRSHQNARSVSIQPCRCSFAIH
jgi:hypothetical protein